MGRIFCCCLNSYYEFMLQGVGNFVSGEQDIGIFEELAGKREFGVSGRVFEVMLVTHFLIMFPKVWSSLLTVKIAAFVTFVSNSLIILRKNKENPGNYGRNVRWMVGERLLTFSRLRTAGMTQRSVEHSFSFNSEHFTLNICSKNRGKYVKTREKPKQTQ